MAAAKATSRFKNNNMAFTANHWHGLLLFESSEEEGEYVIKVFIRSLSLKTDGENNANHLRFNIAFTRILFENFLVNHHAFICPLILLNISLFVNVMYVK